MAVRKQLKLNYYGFLGFLGFLGFINPWNFFFFAFFLFFLVPANVKTIEKVVNLNSQQTEKKEENVSKVLEMFDRQEKVANNDVERELGVSDATATRYLEELERQGKIRQVGNKGQNVYYIKV